MSASSSRMGFLEVQSFCCGFAPLHKGCKIIAVASASYSLAVFLVAALYQDLLIAGAAYVLLFFALVLLYGILERVKGLLIFYLFLRALTLALELADIMRSLGMGTSDTKDLVKMLLTLLDFCMNLYFWLVVFSFCVNPSSYNIGHPNLFPNVPHYPPVPDEKPLVGSPTSRRDSHRSADVSSRSARDSVVASPYNLIHQPARGGPASPSTSSSDVFTYSGIPVTQATPRSPRSPRPSVDAGSMDPLMSPGHAAGRRRSRSPRPQPRPRPHPRAENIKYALDGMPAQTNPFL